MVVVAAIALTVYLRTLAPTVTWAHHGADGGDLITAVVTGGVPHPTGYPTYLLLGRLFLLVPWGDAARRLNLMSAVFAALAVGLLYDILLRTWRLVGGQAGDLRPRLVAGATALAFAFSPLLWSQAVIAEVHTLNVFFVALTIDLLLRWTCSSNHWVLGTAAFTFGLGLGNHMTLALLAPAILLSVWWQRDELFVAGMRRLAVLPLLFLLGLSVYATLPLRAAQRPYVNWGDPRTWDGVRWLVSGRLYEPFVFALPLRYVPRRLAAWATLLVRQFGWWGLLLGLLGLRSLWQQGRRVAVVLTAIVVSASTYAVGYDTSDSQLYLIPAFLVFAVWLGWGLLVLVEQLQRWMAPAEDRLALAVPLCLAVLIPVIPLISNYTSIDLRNDDGACSYGLAVLDAVEPGAVIVSQTDAHTFALWYFRYAERRRTDVAVLDGDLLRHPWYRRNANRTHPWIGLSEKTIAEKGDGAGVRSFSLTTFVQEQLKRHPVYLTDPDGVIREHFTLSERGPVYQVVSRRERAARPGMTLDDVCCPRPSRWLASVGQSV